MTPFAARCTVVGAAVVLLVVGLVVPVAAASRAVVLGAAACCAVLDVLVVRATRNRPVDGADGAEGVDRAEVAAAVEVAAPAGVRRPAPGAEAEADEADGGVRSDETEPRGRSIVLGTTSDGRALSVDDPSLSHVLVIGVGVLAEAVFRAVASQVRAAAGPDDDVRAASGPGSLAVVPGETGRCPAMPDGTAALVVDHARARRDRGSGSADGVGRMTSATGSARVETASECTPTRPPARTTVVLVPGLSVLPRQWDVAVEVTRHGCAVRYPHERRGVPVRPALPELAGPERPVPG